MLNFASELKKPHIEHLLWSHKDNSFYTIITPEFGGGGALDAAITQRSRFLPLLKMGIRNIESKPIGLGLSNMHKISMTHKEIQEKFNLYGNYKNMFIGVKNEN